MKKLLALLMISATALAGPKEELSHRLQLSEGFSADFQQTVTSPDGDIVMEGEGKVDIARPSLFRWTTTFPDENVLVSDGKTLWYYDPFVEQVSIYWQEQATSQTPFVLLTRNRAQDWDNYNVTQKENTFILLPVSENTNQGKFEIYIDSKGQVQGFRVIEQDGQESRFKFSNLTLAKPPSERFEFLIPDGVNVDDQRN